MFKRDAESRARKLLRGFPILTITGPRQSGKTTLARALLERKPYLSLEDPDIRRMAFDDPRGLLDRMPNGGVLDEVQRAPELVSYLQTRVDADGRMGLFLLTGSQQFGLLSGISQSLAGRTAFLELLPLSRGELDRAKVAPPTLNESLLVGGYPVLYDRELKPASWFAAYVTAYVERDVWQLLKVQDLEAFQRFVRLCAGRSGQILNLSSLATDCGIRHNTARAWLSVLEASYLIFALQPHHANFNKRLIKAPKIYFYDTGLLCWLLGIREVAQLEAHPLRGAIFETYVVAELIKARFNQGERAGLHYWRDSNGNEVDVLAEVGTKLMPIEIKAGQTVNPDFFTALNRWTVLAGDLSTTQTVIYGGTDSFRRSGIRIMGWNGVANAFS